MSITIDGKQVNLSELIDYLESNVFNDLPTDTDEPTKAVIYLATRAMQADSQFVLIMISLLETISLWAQVAADTNTPQLLPSLKGDIISYLEDLKELGQKVMSKHNKERTVQ